jgi:AcrR family transcriptional regulator
MGRPPIIERRALMAAARDLFTTKGYQATTLADIAAPLKVTPAAILRHAQSKQALYVEDMTESSIQLPSALTKLSEVNPLEDPQEVLSDVARAMIPFLRQRINHMIALYTHLRANPDFFTVPAAVRGRSGGPGRALTILENYFGRVRRAGQLRVRSPRAAALLFLGSLQSYVFFHYGVSVSPKPFPIRKYLDSLFELWTEGALGGRSGRA